MKKEIRAELRDLKKQRTRQQDTFGKFMKASNRVWKATERAFGRSVTKIDRRIAILEGRLS